jgi:hypothetical protein
VFRETKKRSKLETLYWISEVSMIVSHSYLGTPWLFLLGAQHNYRFLQQQMYPNSPRDIPIKKLLLQEHLLIATIT